MILVQNRGQFDAALNMLQEASIIAVDTETDGLNISQGNRLIGFSTHCVIPDSDYAINFYFPFRHRFEGKQINLFTVSENLPVEWLPEFASVLNRDDVQLIFHHLKFDAQVFRADGLWIKPNIDNVEDTMVKAQLVDENISHRLEDLAATAFGEEVRKTQRDMKKLVAKVGGYHKTTPQQMGPYACQDAQLTHDLNPLLDASLKRQGISHLVRREVKFQEVMMEMEWEGIELDRDLAQQLSKRARIRMRQIEDELGFDPQSHHKLSHVLFGKKSTGGLELPYEEITKNVSKEFPDGIPAMGVKILVGLRHPIADLVLEYRGIAKANSTWYQGWLKKSISDGRIHPTYNVSEKKEKFGTVTSRLSSFIQQMPRDPNAMVKQLLRPPVGYTMVEFDYSQIEYRLAACYAGDDDLIEQFKNGVDTHQELANSIGIDRQSAKQVAYTVLYGGQGKALAFNLEKQIWQNQRKIVNISESDGQAIVNAYYAVHPKLKQISKLAEYNARAHGWVQLWNGRRRHFDPKQPWTHRKSFNSVLQGGAAQIIVESMIYFHEMRDIEPFRMRIQVHDSLWFEVPVNDFDRCTELISKTMEWPSDKFPVPFPVEYKIIRGRELELKDGSLSSFGPGENNGLGFI